MRIFAQYGYHGQDLSDLNHCRMFLHTIWLSDICNGTGTEVLENYWSGTHPIESPYQWPPTKVRSADWKLWQQALQTCLGLDRWRWLGRPLGKWLPTDRGWFYEPMVSCLWKKQADGWRYFTYIPLQSRSQFFDATGFHLEQPPVRQQLRRAVVIDWKVLNFQALLLE